MKSWQLTASEALNKFQDGSLSPFELMHDVINRTEETKPGLNAFCDQYFEEALLQAKSAEAAYLREDTNPPLLGLPLAIKDDTPIAKRVTTGGSLFLKDHVDDITNPSVQRLLDAGANVHARTTCPEFCWAWNCYSRIHGVTKNPWGLDYTPGGSSGGSAAALAAGSAMLATGTDSAGSIRQPASLCGVVGFKPPYGRNPASASSSFDSNNHIGPMARSVADCALMQNAMSGLHPLDHATIPQQITVPTEPESIKGLKLAWSPDLDCYNVDPDVIAQTEETLKALQDAGAIVEQVDTPWAKDAIYHAGNFGDLIYRRDFESALANHAEDLCDYTLYFIEQIQSVTPSMFSDAVHGAGMIWQDHFAPLLQKYDGFICPTTTHQRIPAAMKPWEKVLVNGKEEDINDTTMTILFNMYSRCPVLALPSGQDRHGMPTGIQIVGRPFDDVTVFKLGLAIEGIRPWTQTAPI